MVSIEQVSSQVSKVIRCTLNLKEDITLEGDADLVNEIGLDSLEAFEAMASLHDILGIKIPDQLNPKSLSTIDGIAAYVVDTCEPATVAAFLAVDVEAHLASLQDDGSRL